MGGGAPVFFGTVWTARHGVDLATLSVFATGPGLPEFQRLASLGQRYIIVQHRRINHPKEKRDLLGTLDETVRRILV